MATIESDKGDSLRIREQLGAPVIDGDETAVADAVTDQRGAAATSRE